MTVNLLTVSYGNMIGFVTVALPNLHLNSNEGSWFASIDLFSIMIFAPLGGVLSDWLGRKKTMILFSPGYRTFGPRTLGPRDTWSPTYGLWDTWSPGLLVFGTLGPQDF